MHALARTLSSETAVVERGDGATRHGRDYQVKPEPLREKVIADVKSYHGPFDDRPTRTVATSGPEPVSRPSPKAPASNRGGPRERVRSGAALPDQSNYR
jgi:hypothetical protein